MAARVYVGFLQITYASIFLYVVVLVASGLTIEDGGALRLHSLELGQKNGKVLAVGYGVAVLALIYECKV